MGILKKLLSAVSITLTAWMAFTFPIQVFAQNLPTFSGSEEDNTEAIIVGELTSERESYNKINISPKPDSLLRVAIHIKKVDKKVNIKKQSLKKFKRKGFVAVEWGGMTY